MYEFCEKNSPINNNTQTKEIISVKKYLSFSTLLKMKVKALELSLITLVIKLLQVESTEINQKFGKVNGKFAIQ